VKDRRAGNKHPLFRFLYTIIFVAHLLTSISDDNITKFGIDVKKVVFSKISELSDISQLDCTENDGSDVQGLQDFLCNYALSHQKQRLSSTHLVYHEGSLMGYVTVTVSTLPIQKVMDEVQTSEEIKRYPVLLIANLAVDKRRRKEGFGSIMLKHCIGLADLISDIAGCRYVMLYASKAVTFYSDKNNTPYKFMELEEKNGLKLMIYKLYDKG
jgi:GNAT superfamily N-acetyltransferase